jgi:hypothetical protein
MLLDKSMLQTLRKTKDKVKFVMEMFPDTRNNDNLLCTTYWKEVDDVKDIAGVQFATPAEAIRRSRQLINQKGLLLATDPLVLEKRKQKAKEMTAGITRM